ncbi:helix-turn-helix domain-containing protein [Salibacterium lacus]|uniref:Helix-turn-helix domain-containing protein n=1 Tax=Salibacterium lacus TaxID=1898109 RepID=A0ABW5T4U0_9BACI
MTISNSNHTKVNELISILSDMTGLAAGYYSSACHEKSAFQFAAPFSKGQSIFEFLYNRVENVECFLYDEGEGCYFFSVWMETLQGFFITGPYRAADAVPDECLVYLPDGLQAEEAHAPYKYRHHYVRTMVNSMIRHYFYYYPGIAYEYDWITQGMNEAGMDYVYHPYEQEKKFLEYFKNTDPEGFEMLKNLEQETDMTFGSEAPVRELKNYLIVLCAILTRPLIEIGVTSTEVMTMNRSLLSKIENSDTLNQLNEQKTEILNSFYYIMKKERNKGYSPFTRQVREFIQSHLRKPVDVKTVADYMNLTPGYVSTMFKEECGVTLKRYILESKIREAERLVIYSDMPLSDIALMLCFNDQTYFTKAFKRITGRTPMQYRKQGS